MDLYLMADWETAKSAANGANNEALRCFDELRDPLRRYLMCAGASAADADDAVQETFLRLYWHLEKSGGLSNLHGWVFQVARNYLRDERKSARRQRSAPLDEALNRHNGIGSPEHSALSEERSRRLREAIEKLPQQQRECMLLRSSGLRYREIAEILGIGTSSVGPLVQRAMARLSEELS